MSIGVFTDKSRAPTVDEVSNTLGPRRSDWDQVIELLGIRYGGSSEFKFYGKNYGWALRFYKGCYSLASVFPAQEALSVLIILNPDNVEQALSLDLGPNAREALEQANPYPEGRWLFIPIHAEKDMEDVRSLLALKFPPRRRSARTAPASSQA